MMKRVLAGAACALTMLGATAAPAQEREPRPEIIEGVSELIRRMRIMTESLGMEDMPLPPREPLTRALDAATPLLPEDYERAWDATFIFDFRTTVSDGALEPDPRRGLVTDAVKCIQPNERGEVVHFERLQREDVRGHRCIILVQLEDPDVWVFYAFTFAEGPGRRLIAEYGLSVLVDQEGATARRLIEERLPANIGLAEVIGDNAFDLMMAKPRGGGARLSQEDLAARMAGMGERLDELAAPLPF